MPFVCEVCVRAFLPPSAAADEYLSTITHATTELDSHSEAAALGRSRDTRCTRVLSCGVVIGVCTSCDTSHSLPRAMTRKQWGPCTSRRHPSSSSSPAKCTPGPGAIPHLWIPITADQERASAPADRTKVCSGFKTGAGRDEKRARLAGQASKTRHSAALTTWAVVSSAAQYLPVLPPATPALPALPAAPELVNNLGGLLPLDCATAKNGREANARALAVAQFHDPRPLRVASASGTSPGARQDQPWVSAEPYLAALLARYESLTAPELGSLDKLINLHLATTKPPEVSVAFKNGVNRTYVWVSQGRGGPVGERHLRRQAATLSKLQAQITSGRASTYQPAIIRLLRHPRQSKGLAVVPGQGSSPLPPRLQELLAARISISGMQWSRLREGFGGRDSCFARREAMRAAATAISNDPGRQVRTDERGAHLVDFRSALECLAEALWSSDQWVDRFVRDGTGAKVPHTEAFVLTPPGQPYTPHSDSTADLHLCVGLDKGGRGTPTAKLLATVANQARPQSRSNSILIPTTPCIRDDNAGLHEMIGPWVMEPQRTLTRVVAVGGTLRAVRLIWTGDLAFLSAFVGHAGATARFPCVFCPAVSRPGPLHAELIAKYGTLQRPDAPPADLRTRRKLQEAMEAFRACDNDGLPLPLSPSQHLCIVKCPHRMHKFDQVKAL